MSRSDMRDKPERQPEASPKLDSVGQGSSGGGSTDDLRRPESASGSASRIRERVYVRDRAYRVSPAEREVISAVAKFRSIGTADLTAFHYGDNRKLLAQDITNLREQDLVREHRVMLGPGREKFSCLVLTKQGKQLAEQERTQNPGQVLYSGWVKPREAGHDAALYRMYRVEAAAIERAGGKIRRVVLDYELKKKIYSPLEKRRGLPPTQFAKLQAEVAAENGLKVIDGKIPLPDLRIEYETSAGEATKVDLELATEHYHAAHASEKLRAGFKTYADAANVSRLNAALTRGGSAISDGPELAASILSL